MDQHHAFVEEGNAEAALVDQLEGNILPDPFQLSMKRNTFSKKIKRRVGRQYLKNKGKVYCGTKMVIYLCIEKGGTH
jgi:hypothetical protein